MQFEKQARFSWDRPVNTIAKNRFLGCRELTREKIKGTVAIVG